MLPPEILFFIAFAFLAAGLIKGLTGLGLPAASLGILLLAIDMKQAIVILLVPLFVTNIWQSVIGGQIKTILIRLWPLLGAGMITIWFAVGIMITTDPALLRIALGVILISYSAYSLATPQARPPGRWEPLLTPLAGATSGIIGGFTGSLAVPAVLYMQTLGMSRDALIQAMGIWFCMGSVALSIALGGRGALPPELAMISVGAIVPAIAGMEIGRRLRQRLSEELFRKILFCALLLLGIFIAARGYIES